jgi:hypothetical protein
VEKAWAEGQVPVTGGRGEKGLALFEGHEQQVTPAGFMPEHAFTVNPRCVITEDTKRRFDFGAAVVAVHAQRHW